MQLSYWGMSESPFRAQERIRFFFASPTHDEALARLGFLVDSGHSLGILTGHDGVGRSTVLEVFARGLRQQGHVVCAMNLLGLDERSFLWTLAAGLGCNPRAAEASFSLNCRISDRLREFALTGRTAVLLLDDADQAAHEVLIQIQRLLKTHVQRPDADLGYRIVASGSTRGRSAPVVPTAHPLEPWSADDIREYLETSLSRVGCNRPVFEDSATLRLHELTDGTPRWVAQLAELALLAAASHQQDTVDGSMIEAVYQELSATFAEDPLGCTY
jgi:general secretion pathway protein A